MVHTGGSDLFSLDLFATYCDIAAVTFFVSHLYNEKTLIYYKVDLLKFYEIIRYW